MDMKKEWEEKPPVQNINTLDGLVQDFIDRFPRERRDFVVPYTAESNSISQAIARAVSSVDANNKQHHHSFSISEHAMDNCFVKLIAQDDSLIRSINFHDLYKKVKRVLKDVNGIDDVYIYDIAVRIGSYLGLEPERIYLHSGVAVGAAKLGLIEFPESLEYNQMPEALKAMTPDMIEDFLCCMRKVFTREMRRS